jgi:hypothetical protein
MARDSRKQYSHVRLRGATRPTRATLTTKRSGTIGVLTKRHINLRAICSAMFWRPQV